MAIIALGQDDTRKQRLEHPPRREKIIQRRQRPTVRRSRHCLKVGPHGRDHQVAAVRQHDDQLQPTAAPHPPHQPKRAALPRMPSPDDPHRRRKAIEMGSVSCLPLTASTTRR
jgi:hypothetical protein